MASQVGDGEAIGQDKTQPELTDLVAMLENAIAALDAACETLAAAHVDMGRQVLIARNQSQESSP